MKKYFALAMALLMSIGLVACGGSGQTAPASSAPSTSASAPAAPSTPPAAEAEWPDGNISLIVSAGAGGGTDIAARQMLTSLSKMGNFAVINNTDGGGVVAWEQVKAADPSCNEILFFNPGLLSSYVTGLTDVNPVEDIIPVWAIANANSYYIIVNKNSPFNSMEELVDYAKANPGKLNFGVQMGDMEHVMAGCVQKELGVEWNYVAAGSDADRVSLLIGGNLDVTICAQSQTQSYYDADEIKVLCSTLRRSPIANEKLQAVPLLSELGYNNTTIAGGLAVWAPAGAPDSVYEKINETLNAAITDPEVVQLMADSGSVVTSVGNYQEASQYINNMFNAYKDACNDLGLAAEGRG